MDRVASQANNTSRVFQNIATERCVLRWFRESDLEAFTAYRSVPEIARYQGWSSFSYADALELYRDLSNKPFGIDGEWYQIALADKQSDALIGDLALHFVEPGIAEVGFTVAPAHQGRGYAREGLHALLGYLFDALEYEWVLAVTDVKNLASIGVLESVGFERAPGEPRKLIFKGEPGEEFDYSMTRKGWLAT